MVFMSLFTIGTGGHYITMLPVDWSIYPHHTTLCPSVAIVKNAMESIYTVPLGLPYNTCILKLELLSKIQASYYSIRESQLCVSRYTVPQSLGYSPHNVQLLFSLHKLLFDTLQSGKRVVPFTDPSSRGYIASSITKAIHAGVGLGLGPRLDRGKLGNSDIFRELFIFM